MIDRSQFALGLIIKVTRRCNLRCTYCNDWRAPSESGFMTDETATLVFRRAFERSDRGVTNFVWHGGEPTLARPDFYDRVLSVQQSLKPAGHIANNVIQTNGVSFGPRWFDLIERYNVGVGVSLDGPPELHDKLRLRIGGQPSHSSVMKTIEAIRGRVGEPAVLMVLSEEMIRLGPERLWAYLNAEGLSDVDLIPARPPNNLNGRTIKPEGVKADSDGLHDEWTQYLCDLFDLWWSSNGQIRINTFESVVRKMVGGTPRSCLISGDCLGYYFGVETNGIVFICGLYEDVDEYTVGDVYKNSLQEMCNGETFRRVATANQKRLARHRDCQTFDLCAGGCPHDFFLARRYVGPDAYSTCCGWSGYLEHIRDRVQPALEARTWLS